MKSKKNLQVGRIPHDVQRKVELFQKIMIIIRRTEEKIGQCKFAITFVQQSLEGWRYLTWNEHENQFKNMPKKDGSFQFYRDGALKWQVLLAQSYAKDQNSRIGWFQTHLFSSFLLFNSEIEEKGKSLHWKYYDTISS